MRISSKNQWSSWCFLQRLKKIALLSSNLKVYDVTLSANRGCFHGPSVGKTHGRNSKQRTYQNNSTTSRLIQSLPTPQNFGKKTPNVGVVFDQKKHIPSREQKTSHQSERKLIFPTAFALGYVSFPRGFCIHKPCPQHFQPSLHHGTTWRPAAAPPAEHVQRHAAGPTESELGPSAPCHLGQSGSEFCYENWLIENHPRITPRFIWNCDEIPAPPPKRKHMLCCNLVLY